MVITDKARKGDINEQEGTTKSFLFLGVSTDDF